MSYVLARLGEPGTLRSLAVVLFALLGLSPDDPRIEGAVQIAILVLGLASAFMPERKVDPAAVAAEVAPAVAGAVTEAVLPTVQTATAGAVAEAARTGIAPVMDRLRRIVGGGS